MDEPIHFRWHPFAIAKGNAPDCGDGPRTDDLDSVTCDDCQARIVAIVQEWAADNLESEA